MAVAVGVGLSLLSDSYIAGVQAAREARQGIERVGLCLVFCSIHHNALEAIAGIASQIPRETIFGTSCFVEISNAGSTSRSIVVAILDLDGIPIPIGHAAIGTNENSFGESITRQIIENLGGKALESQPIALLLRDLATPDAGEMFKSLFARCGEMPVFGGMSSGDYDLGLEHPDFWKSWQFFAGEPHRNWGGLALLNLPKGDFTTAFGFAHGWVPVGPRVEVTRAEGHRIFEINHQPIFDYYRQFLDGADSEKFFSIMVQRYGFAVERTFGEQRKSIIKIPVSCNLSEGYIEFFPAENFQGQTMRLFQAGRTGVIEGAREAARQCLAALDGQKPAFIMVASCCLRASILHSKINLEIEAIQEILGQEIPIFGFYTGGEMIPYLNRPEEVIDPKNPLRGSHYHVTTCGVMAIATTRETRIHHLPRPEIRYLGPEIEEQRLRDQLLRSENILDDTQKFLASLSRKSYESGEKLKIQNQELQIRNEKNLQLQRVVRRYTPHVVWRQAGDTVDRGQYELPESEMIRTFLFMDVKGFTSFSEQHPPNLVIAALNRIFRPATDLIYAHGGDVDKYIGDCIFAAFPDERSGVSCGKQLLELFSTLSGPEFPFGVRIGINCGKAIHGNVGSPERREYTYIGDAVNVTQRLEANCAVGKILISAPCFDRAGISFPHLEKREITLKGKTDRYVAYQCGI